MFTGSLLATALLMGLAATPHCASMCAAACAASRAHAACANRSSPWNHRLAASAPVLVGRLIGYGVAGAAAASLGQSLVWLGTSLAWARPFWNIAQVLMLGLGLMLLFRGAFPIAIVDRVERLRRGTTAGASATAAARAPSVWRRLGLATLWPAIPCGVLHAALLLATLASSAGEGALVLLVFGIGSTPGLVLGSSLWLKVAQIWRRAGPGLSVRPEAAASMTQPSGRIVPVVVVSRPLDAAPHAAGPASDALAVRMAGAMLAATAAWWLVGHHLAPAVIAWCS